MSIAVTVVYHQCPEDVKVYQFLASHLEYGRLVNLRGTLWNSVGLTEKQEENHKWLYELIEKIPPRDPNSDNTLCQSELIVTGQYL